VRALEGVIAEQEAMKWVVCTLRKVMEECRREIDFERAQQEERICRDIEEARCPPDLHRAERNKNRRVASILKTRKTRERKMKMTMQGVC